MLYNVQYLYLPYRLFVHCVVVLLVLQYGHEENVIVHSLDYMECFHLERLLGQYRCQYDVS